MQYTYLVISTTKIIRRLYFKKISNEVPCKSMSRYDFCIKYCLLLCHDYR